MMARRLRMPVVVGMRGVSAACSIERDRGGKAMTGTDRLGALLAAIFVVSIPAATVVAAPAPQLATSQSAAPPSSRYLVTGNLSPATIQAQIEQVGEGADVETLDEGAPPPQTPAPTGAVTGGNATNQDDVELLDQGAPPVTSLAAPAPATTAAPAAAPAAVPVTAAAPPPAETTSSTAPASSAPAGPALPPGFGTGQVHVSTGAATFPPGLANCHVGAVTGRAYVGVDCGEGGTGNDSFVGHAPSFNDFPFVVDPGFPFNRDSGFFASGGNTSNDTGFFASHNGSNRNTGGVVSASGTSPRDTGRGNRDTVAGGSSNIDTGTVNLTQRAKTRKPRVRVDNSGASSEQAGHDKKSKRTQSDTASVSTEHRRGNPSNNSVTRAQKSGKHAHKNKKGKDRKAKAERKKQRSKSENKKKQSTSDEKQKRQQEKKNNQN